MTTVAVGIAALAIGVAAVVVLLIVRANPPRLLAVTAIVSVLMAAQFGLAEIGLLRQWARVPPPFLLMMTATMAVTIFAAASSLGRRVAATTPVAARVGSQAFRLPLELVMHHAATIGLMPVQMSYSGRNLDIVTGALAIPVALLAAAGHAPRALIRAWNLLGLALLLNIVIIAIASLPAFAAFGSDRLNTWVADVPYVWLPGVLVPAALIVHIVTFRKIWSRA
jgi:hypothetical protein